MVFLVAAEADVKNTTALTIKDARFGGAPSRQLNPRRSEHGSFASAYRSRGGLSRELRRRRPGTEFLSGSGRCETWRNGEVRRNTRASKAWLALRRSRRSPPKSLALAQLDACGRSELSRFAICCATDCVLMRHLGQAGGGKGTGHLRCSDLGFFKCASFQPFSAFASAQVPHSRRMAPLETPLGRV